jgi:hypothetical protein
MVVFATPEKYDMADTVSNPLRNSKALNFDSCYEPLILALSLRSSARKSVMPGTL